MTCEHVSLVENLLIIIQKMEISMSGLNAVKGWVGAVTDLGLMLLGLAIVASILVGNSLPCFGGVVANLTDLVKGLGGNGLVGLIVLGIVMWLLSKRSLS